MTTRIRLHLVSHHAQQPHLLEALTVLKNIVLPGLLAGDKPRAEVVARGRELMEQVGISESADHDVTQASRGQLQRTGTCRALSNEPRVIFGDEPTGALNTSSATQVLDIRGSINASGTTLVLVTHDPAVAARAHRVVLLTDGQIADDQLRGAWHPADGTDRLKAVTLMLADRGAKSTATTASLFLSVSIPTLETQQAHSRARHSGPL